MSKVIVGVWKCDNDDCMIGVTQIAKDPEWEPVAYVRECPECKTGKSTYHPIDQPSPCCQQAKAEALDKVKADMDKRFAESGMVDAGDLYTVIDKVKESK